MEGQPKRKVSNCQEELNASNRPRKCGKREQETPEERERRLKEQKARKASRRAAGLATQTPEERARRLKDERD
jgi:hypothetical protein